MASKHPDSPWTSSTFLPFSPLTRRGSVTSLSSRAGVDKQSLAQALDDIHASASRTTGLTAFNEFAPPPLSANSSDRGFVGNLPASLGGIYARLRSSVGVTKDRPSVSPASRSRKRSSLGYELADPPTPLQSPDRADTSNSASPPPSRNSNRTLRSEYDDRVDIPRTSQPTVSSAGSDTVASNYGSGPASVHISPVGESIDQTRRTLSRQAGDGIASRVIEAESIDLTQSDAEMQLIGASRRLESRIHSMEEMQGTMPVPQSLTPMEVAESVVNAASTLPNRSTALGPSSAVTRSPTGEARARPPALTSLAIPAASTSKTIQVNTTGETSPARSAMQSPESSLLRGMPFAPAASGKVMQEMRRKVLSKDFWMKDENAKVCFNCGDTFTTFRRKHHCRTCGQIYDAKCTVLISGEMFGQESKLRICKTCENIIVGDDDSSNYSDDDGPASASHAKTIRFSGIPLEDESLDARHGRAEPDGFQGSTSSMRNTKDLRRRLAAGGVEGIAPQLSRPSSSRSLRSLAVRPRSSSHRPRRPRHQHIRSLGMASDAGSPFHSPAIRDALHEMPLPNFHTDAIIDPDLAPFMSDEGSSDDEQATIATALHRDSNDSATQHTRSRAGPSKKNRPRPMSSRSAFEPSSGSRDPDTFSVTSSRPPTRRHRPTRTLSAASIMGRPDFTSRSSANEYSVGDALTDENLHAHHMERLRQSQISLTSDNAASTVRNDTPKVAAAELDKAGFKHVQILLKQLLRDAKVPRPTRWVNVLVPILLRCAEEIDPDLRRGDAIDIRNFVKLKKAPSGKSSDTSYISGVVFTKNIALKGMTRTIAKPRILILSFPLVYARHKAHFMSLDPVIAQEREYLRNLARRITNLQPSVVLVQRQVAGLALEILEKTGITVVCNVKESVLLAISRCTQTRIVTSLDKLSMDPSQLGNCDLFEFKTFVYDGTKKTYAYVSGCQSDLGCTIVLRGAALPTLRTVKWITEWMCLAVYNLKLETCLSRDQFMSTPTRTRNSTAAMAKVQHSEDPSGKDAAVTSQGWGAEVLESSRSGGTMTGPTEVADDNKKGADKDVDDTISLEYRHLLQNLRSRVLSTSPSVNFAEPYLLLKGQEKEEEMATRRQDLVDLEAKDAQLAATDNAADFELLRPEMIRDFSHPTSAHIKESLKAIRRSEYEKAVSSFASIQRRWETYASDAIDPFSPVSHQQIVVLYSIISTPSGNACDGPDVLEMAFYQEQDSEDGLETDVTLGEYIERICDQARLPCLVRRCDKKMLQHYRQYVHGDGQVNVSIREHPAKLRGFENVMLMWSECRECHQETPAISMSSNTWKLSFAKYLELTFWSYPREPRAGVCPHDIHKCHTRYFGFNNLAVFVQYEPIRILEVILPRGSISWKADKDIHLKNDEYQRIRVRIERFMQTVSARIECINPLNVKPERLEACKIELDSLRKRANDDLDFLLKELEDKYCKSLFYEIVPLNRAVRAMQEKVAGWDRTFADFEQRFLPSEKDIRKLAAQQLTHAYLKSEDIPGAEILEEVKDQSMMDKVVEGEPQSEKALQPLTDTVTEATFNEDHAHPLAVVPGRDAQPMQNVQHLDLAIRAESPASPAFMAKASPTGESGDKTYKTSSDSTSTAETTLQTEQQNRTDVKEETSSIEKFNPVSTASEDNDLSPPRAPGQTSPPPLLRSHTQPSPSPQKQHLSDLLSEASMQESSGKPSQQSSIPVHAKTTYASRLKAREVGQPSKVTSMALKTGKSALQSMIPRSVPKQRLDPKVSLLKKHFEQMSREFEREQVRSRRERAAKVRQAQVYSLASYQPKVEIFEDATEAVSEPKHDASHGRSRGDAGEAGLVNQENFADVDNDDGVDADRQAENASLDGFGETVRSEESTVPQSESPTDDEGALSDTGRPADTGLDEINEKLETEDSPGAQLEFLDIPKHDKTSILKMLSSFWSERSASGWTALDYPTGPTDHIFDDSDVIVREDEPTSMIAFFLASQDYRSRLQKARGHARAGAVANAQTTEPEIEQAMLGDTSTHLKCYVPAGPARAQCTVFFAESFDALRRVCGVSDRFVESLSRCLKWDSRGGKTKSIFLKTLDDRFVIKSVSAIETQAFMRFAPDYFDYMSKCLFHSAPSALAKMLGFYQVTIKNPVTGIDFSHFFQVMENIFYEGPSNRKFDLKGSMRNRKVQSTGEKDEVLLDENLLDYISQAPVYVRYHSLTALASSMLNDTLFCSKQNVMDYSLIVGLYDDRQDLMVGIIDYIRTYTWDKKLESWIKDRGKNKPTVVSPKEYRQRFRASIARYFPLAPSCWQLTKPERLEQVPIAWWESLGVGTSTNSKEVDVNRQAQADPAEAG